VAVYDGADACVERHAAFIGHATNNVAEYEGLLAALRMAIERGATAVELRSDSELIVKQLRGEYKVKSDGLKPLHLEARRIIGGFAAFRIRHVRREDNKDADRLVNEALDLAEREPGAAVQIREMLA
jgi:ribonuclease HI